MQRIDMLNSLRNHKDKIYFINGVSLDVKKFG